MAGKANPSDPIHAEPEKAGVQGGEERRARRIVRYFAARNDEANAAIGPSQAQPSRSSESGTRGRQRAARAARSRPATEW